MLSTSVRHGGQVDYVRHPGESSELRRHRPPRSASRDRRGRPRALSRSGVRRSGPAAGRNRRHGHRREHELRRGRRRRSTKSVEVTAAVTAGVEGNATCAGDPATWRETETGIQKVPAYAGTINTMLLINRPLTPAALARAVVTMTEGKSAALQRLAVPSSCTSIWRPAPAPISSASRRPRPARAPLTSASPHMKLGELVGLATRDGDHRGAALAERARGQLHARRVSRARPLRREGSDDLRRHRAAVSTTRISSCCARTAKAVFYEPLVGAAAHALAAVSRSRPVRHASRRRSQPTRWCSRRRRSPRTWRRRSIGGRSSARTLRADAGWRRRRRWCSRRSALGWSEKWRALI